MSRRSRAAIFAAASAFALIAGFGAARAQSLEFRTPNVETAAPPVTVTVNGQTFANNGIVGVGRIPATTRDFNNESFGAFSAMAIDLNTWRLNADGSYSGGLLSMPDRGPNGVGPITGTTAFQNRLYTETVRFTPTTGAPGTPNTVELAVTGGFFLRDTTGVTFTGKDPGSGVITRGGILYPMPASGEGSGHISMDSEGLALLLDGSFYVSDEYAANVYYFDATGRQVGAINPTAALLPRVGGAVNFSGDIQPDSGRRNNQGLEAVAVTPDQRRLVTILQSATIQDNTLNVAQNRNNTRILVYDISTNRTPTAPVAEYALQLPIFRNSGNGNAPDTTAAQSEALALNGHQFLVLSRDGNGRGNGATRPEVFRSVLLVDTNGATNLAGTAFENGLTPITQPGTGNLVAGITPVSVVPLVNIINPTQLGRFGLNTNTNPSNLNSISEKLEGMALAPVLSETNPQDFFLFIGNDTDFETTNGLVNGQAFDASLQNAGGSGFGNNEPTVLIYRVTLPSYVDPLALQSMLTTTPIAMAGASETAAAMSGVASGAAHDQLNAERRTSQWGGAPYGQGWQVWVQGAWTQFGDEDRSGRPLETDGGSAAGGVDYGFGAFRLGATVGYMRVSGDFTPGFALEGSGWSFGVYGGWAGPGGLYFNGSAAWAPNIDLSQVDRPAAYGLTAQGSSDGDGWVTEGELGWMAPIGGAVRIGPFVGLSHSITSLDGYTEHGASLGNVAIPDRELTRTTATVGLQLEAQLGPVTPSLRFAYQQNDEHYDGPATVRLASAQDEMATQVVAIPVFEGNAVTLEAALQGDAGALSWRVFAGGRWADGQAGGQVGAAAGWRF